MHLICIGSCAWKCMFEFSFLHAQASWYDANNNNVSKSDSLQWRLWKLLLHKYFIQTLHRTLVIELLLARLYATKEIRRRHTWFLSFWWFCTIEVLLTMSFLEVHTTQLFHFDNVDDNGTKTAARMAILRETQLSPLHQYLLFSVAHLSQYISV